MCVTSINYVARRSLCLIISQEYISKWFTCLSQLNSSRPMIMSRLFLFLHDSPLSLQFKKRFSVSPVQFRSCWIYIELSGWQTQLAFDGNNVVMHARYRECIDLFVSLHFTGEQLFSQSDRSNGWDKRIMKHLMTMAASFALLYSALLCLTCSSNSSLFLSLFNFSSLSFSYRTWQSFEIHCEARVWNITDLVSIWITLEPKRVSL